VKVKKQGINPRTWEMDVICPNCKSDLTIGCNDFEGVCITIKDSFLFTTTSEKYIIKCCECGQSIKISKNKLPSIIRKEVCNNSEPYSISMTFF